MCQNKNNCHIYNNKQGDNFLLINVLDCRTFLSLFLYIDSNFSKGNSVKCDRKLTIGKMSILSLHSWVVIKVYIIIKIMSKIIAYICILYFTVKTNFQVWGMRMSKIVDNNSYNLSVMLGTTTLQKVSNLIDSLQQQYFAQINWALYCICPYNNTVRQIKCKLSYNKKERNT